MQKTFIDLFAGIGGFHLAFEALGAKCVFASEINQYARETYRKNFSEIAPQLFANNEKYFAGDITKINAHDIPDFDILTGGFPCQPFSLVGKRKGFAEARGTLFFDIARILKAKQPAAFFLENVCGLLSHNNGKTFQTIQDIIQNKLDYSFFFKVIKASDFGLPQRRPRLYMVGFKDKSIDFKFPEPTGLQLTMSEVLNAPIDRDIGYTLRVGGRRSGINKRQNWDCYLVNDKPHFLTHTEAAKMQGFPADFKFPVSDSQAMKQLGNSVAIPAVRAVAEQLLLSLEYSSLQNSQTSFCEDNNFIESPELIPALA